MTEQGLKCSFETRKAADTGSEAILAISWPLALTARSGSELGVGCDGRDKSQWHCALWQQLIGCSCASAQGADMGWHSSECAGLPSNDKVSTAVSILSAARIMGLTLCVDLGVVKERASSAAAQTATCVLSEDLNNWGLCRRWNREDL